MVSDAKLTDALYPFQIDAGQVRGRFVRLADANAAILGAHGDYPDAISRLMSEAMAVTAVLAGGLKFEGIFTLQAQGDGPLSLMVVDVTSGGDLRGYARFDKDRLNTGASDAPLSPLGKGYLAFTVDQGEHMERYQGIVELEGGTFSEAVEAYFQQSEQLETVFRVAARPEEEGWTSAALMIQRMPIGGEGAPILTAEEADENWNRAKLLLATLKDEEMLDPTLSAERLLHRLYHDDGLQVSAPRPVQAQCRCSEDRLLTALKTLPQDDRADILTDEGTVEVVCEFCKTVYTFTEQDLKPEPSHKG